MNRFRGLIAVASAAVATTGAVVATVPVGAAGYTSGAPATTPQASCSTVWGSQPKQAGRLSTAPLVATRTGRHACYDRVVFQFSGDATGYRVRYEAQVYTEGRGLPMAAYTAHGGPLLSVTLLEPAYDQHGKATYHRAVGQHVANLLGYRTLRDVLYGGSFEGHTTFAVGVRARLPFRVFHIAGPGSGSRIILDIAHAW